MARTQRLGRWGREFKSRRSDLKNILIGIFVLLAALFLIFSFNKQSSLFEYKINNKIYKLLTAKNSEGWQRGLMFYKDKKELKGADGMIFIFPDKQIRTFWNKNTYLDLDVYWLEDKKVVGKDYLPSIEKSKETVFIKSKEKVNRVVELAL